MSQKGLFSRLQTYFKASFGGRYFEHLIKETISEQPKLALHLFGIKDCAHVEVEHRFNGPKRSADLAFLDKERQLVCLVEIKYEDQENPRNREQFKDYLRYSRKHRCKFICLTQHVLPEHDRVLLQKWEMMLFSDLAERLRVSDSAVGGLLRRFFEDKGLVMHKFEKTDESHLKAFLFRFFNPYAGQGRSHTKEAMSGGVADAFGDLLRNMNIIAREVTAAFDGRTTIDFSAEQWVYTQGIRKRAEEENHEELTTHGSKSGGQLWVYGNSVLDGRKYLSVEFGLGLEVRASDSKIYPTTYASVYIGRKGIDSPLKPVGNRIIYDKPRAVAALKQRIREAIDKTLRSQLSAGHAKKLKVFRRAISS